MKYDDFIHGGDATEQIVSVEIDKKNAYLYKEDGTRLVRPHTFWILYAQRITNDCVQLAGANHYNWIRRFENRYEFYKALRVAKDKNYDHHVVYNLSEQHMLTSGTTCHLGMTPKDLSVLSFDIETTGLKHDDSSKVLLIACTYRKGDKLERRLFSYDDYSTQKEMVNAWCSYVRDLDPSVITGHNIYGFDLPYLEYCANELPLGKDGSPARRSNRPSLIRKDQNTFYEYFNYSVHGRQVIDTFNLSIKYDVARNYPSYGLKAIIKYEGLERKGRQHYDASQIYKRYKDKNEWKKIKEYAIDDGDDALKLFDLMIPAYFYFSQSVPMNLQYIINRNSGAQVNAFLCRSYLAIGQGLPKADDPIRYEGGISYGEPGIYENCFKVDVASLYPSIIQRYEVENTDKDPRRHFLKMVKRFTEERLENKRLAKETGERSYDDKSSAQKIFINSAYGFLNARGLNFNYPEGADIVCRHARHILRKGINFATRRGYGIVNADTDSFMIHSFTGSPSEFVSDLNKLYKTGIVWEDDGEYKSVLVLKAKNYVLLSKDGQVTTKGAAIKATMKEPALQQFIDEVVQALLKGEREYDILNRYNRISGDLHRITSSNIGQWCSKKTVTSNVLHPKRTQENRIKEAIERSKITVKEGDKVSLFFETDDRICLKEGFSGTYDKTRLAKKLYNTMAVFSSVLDMGEFPNYSLKRNRKQFESLRQTSGLDNQRLHEDGQTLSIFETGA